MTHFLITGLLGILIWGVLGFAAYHANRPVMYDCSLTSFHPDYPAAVRKKCREVKQ